jgi:DNA mismatch endonuclease (patch repair protein)
MRLAVFIDGCFWHGCPEHGEIPMSNREWWIDKLAKTQERDLSTSATLLASGWRVLRCWEHQASVSIAERIRDELQSLRAPVDRS